MRYHKRPIEPFELRDATFGGNGLVEELQGASGERLRDLAYEGRGS